ncbi:adenylate cyclase [Methylophilaceae bacterium]|nr:adenylate cyclase [Methylophilaceae bacterium]
MNIAVNHHVSKKTVLIVDDIPDSLSVMNALLKDFYVVKVAISGEMCLKIASVLPRPDLILLDIMMPDIDGYEVCKRLKADPYTAEIPVIFLTAKVHMEDEQLGFDVGAVDYVTKPVSPPILLARVNTHLQLKVARDILKDQKSYLEQQVQMQTREVAMIQDATILAMASLAETRDNETGNHIRRTQNYVRVLAQRLQYHPRFAAYLNRHIIDLIYKSAPLHDIGKVGIPDHILLKPGKLTPEEFEVMKTHTILGCHAVMEAEKRIEGSSHNFLQYAREISLSHHEKWDGSGYPQGLKGDDIPVSARLMALADVYDALISRRVYKEPYSHAEAHSMIVAGRGSHFDPDVVDAFVELAGDFRKIALQYTDDGL